MSSDTPTADIPIDTISPEAFAQLARDTADAVRTPQEIAASEYAERILCRRRLLPFVQRFNPSYEAGWVHKDICSRLEKFSDDIIAKKSPRLMIWCPPRSGKSELVSRNFPAWHVGRVPEHEFIVTSYSSSLAMKFSRSVRSLLREPAYEELFPKTKLDTDSQSVEFWQTTAGGAYMAAGVSGPLTGNGMNCVHLSTVVPTSHGPRSLDWLIKNRHLPVKLLSFDGTRIVESIPNGYITRLSDHYYRVGFSDGSSLSVTGEHPVCIGVNETSPVYRRVDDLRVGESVIVPRQSVTPGAKTVGVMSDVPEYFYEGLSEVPHCGTPDSLLLEQVQCEVQVTGYEYERGVLPVQGDVSYGECCAQAEATEGADGVFLFRGLLWDSPVADVYRGEQSEVHLDQTSLRAVWHPTFTHSVEAGRSEGSKHLLWPHVLPRVVARSAYTPGRHPGGEVLPARVQESAEEYSVDASAVRGLLTGAGDRGASPRCEQREQCVFEPSSGLSSVPYATPPGFTELGVTSIERVDGTTVVGDISVPLLHNFLSSNLVTMRNCGIIDDPTKNREEAESTNIRQGIKEWYTSTFYTRLAPGAGILVIMTRWHHDDLAGWLLEEEKSGGDKWEVVSYPAIAEHDEKYRRQGEALHPERYDLEALMRIQRAVGPRDWQALYQQQPTATEGAYFKKEWFRYYLPHELPALDDMTLYTAWDFAIGTKDGNDYTVGLTVAVDRQHNIYVIDIARGRWDALQICDTILDTWATFPAQRVGMERGQISMALGPLLEKRIAERDMYSFPYDPEGLKTGRADKEMRATPIQGRTRQGKVLFPRHAAWLAAFEAELLSFPSGTHDDQVDAYAWIGQMMGLYAPPTAPKPKAPKWLDKLSQLQRQSRKTGGSTALGA